MSAINSPLRLQQGFTLIEVLVALVIIAVGLLGIAGMQALSLNNTTIALNRSIAALQADGMASMMHANQHYWQSNSVQTSRYTIPTGQPDCSAKPCSQTKMAFWDLQQWGASLSSLPSGNGFIDCTIVSKKPVVCKISVTWYENNFGVSGTASGALDQGSYQQTYFLVVEP